MFFALTLSIFLSVANAQTIKELKIGDTLPSINVSYLSGDSIVTVPLETFYKDDYLIIDFWATWCGACIKAMPGIDSVAKMFNNVKVLPVTYEDEKSVKKFIRKSKILSTLNLNYVVNDSILMGGYIKFQVLPHDVWVNTNGVICAITYPDEVTYETINSFVMNQPISVKGKVDDLSFDYSAPLDVQNSSFLYRSVLIPYKPGISSYRICSVPAYIKNVKADRFMATNTDILNLFYSAYSNNHGNIRFNRVELDVRDTFSILSPSFLDRQITRQDHIKSDFCYELILPQKVSQSDLYSYMLDDLNRLFPFTGTIEKRQRQCWVMINKDKRKNPNTSGTQPKLTWEQGAIRKLNNQSMDVLISYLNWEMDSLPVVNETDFSGSFDMTLDVMLNEKTGFFDIERFKKSLNTYGFDLIRAIRPVDVLVIRNKK